VYLLGSHQQFRYQRVWADPMIIGLSGWAGSGKDAIADILVDDFSFTKMGFADPLREMALAINPIIDSDEGLRFIRYSDLLDDVGYERAKRDHLEVRRFLQVLGTEAVREIIGKDTWVTIGMMRAKKFERVVFTDMRFANEAGAIVAAGGTAVRIIRPGVQAVNGHTSEKDLDQWDFGHTIYNNGVLDDLPRRVLGMLDRIAPKP